jgi:hypothetical protein
MGGSMSPKEQSHSPPIEQLQKLHRRRMALFGLVILIAGIAIGAASTVILVHPDKTFPGPDDPAWASLMMTGRLENILDLTPEQKEEIRLISKTAFGALHEIQEKAKPEIDVVIKDMNSKISATLTDEQRPKWQRELEDFQRRLREGWHRGGRRGGDGGGGPDSGRRRGSGDPNRVRRGPGPDGWSSEDPNRPWSGFGPWQGDPNRPREGFRRGAGQFGQGFGPGDPNRPRGDLDREARERYRRGDANQMQQIEKRTP